MKKPAKRPHNEDEGKRKIEGFIMKQKNFRGFEIVLAALLLCTVISFFVKVSLAEKIFSVLATLIVGGVLSYFKITEKVAEHRKKARKLHLDK